MLFLSKSMMVGGSLALLFFVFPGDGGEGHQAKSIDGESRPRTIQLLPQTLGQDSGSSDVVVEIRNGVSTDDKAKNQGLGGMGGVGLGGGGNQFGSQGVHQKSLLDAWKLDSKTAENVREAMDSSYKFDIDVPLSGLSKVLSDLTGQPILLNRRAVKQANQELDVSVKYSREMTPLRTAMRQMLRPLYLRASIENDGIVITADHAALAKEGIGTDAWLNVDEEMERDLSAKLKQRGVFEFRDKPLKECISSLADQFDLKMIIRENALEDIGLASNEPITFTIADVTLQDVLSEMLFALDCTYTLSGGLVVITTAESVDFGEEDQLTRVYWLDGTGLIGQQAIEIITATISPDIWEQLGGPSTITGLINPRAGLVIATKYTVHQKIERMLQTLRDSQFAPDPNLESVVPPMPRYLRGMGGGGMGRGSF